MSDFDDFNIDSEEIAMFMGMAEEMAEEERELLRQEKDLEYVDFVEDFERKHDNAQPNYMPETFEQRPRRDSFMQYAHDVAHGIKSIGDPLLGPPKKRKGIKKRSQDYTKTVVYGVLIRNAHMVSERFLEFIYTSLYYHPNHEIKSITFDKDGNPVVNGIVKYGTFNTNGRNITINMRYIYNNAVHTVEHGNTSFSMIALIWYSLVEVFLHELWHALDTVAAPGLIYPKNMNKDDIANGWAIEVLTNLARKENIEPPRLTNDPYFGPRIINYLNKMGKYKQYLWPKKQREMIVDGIYYRNKDAGIEIGSMKEFYELSLKGLSGDEAGLRLNECVKIEQEVDNKINERELIVEQAVNEAIEKGYLIKINYILINGDYFNNCAIRPHLFYYQDGFGYVEAFYEAKKRNFTLRADRIINISFQI